MLFLYICYWNYLSKKNINTIITTFNNIGRAFKLLDKNEQDEYLEKNSEYIKTTVFAEIDKEQLINRAKNLYKLIFENKREEK